MVKNLPAMQETRVQSLGQEDLLEKEMATHSSIIAWKIPWTIRSMGWQSQTKLSDFHFHFHIYIYSSIRIINLYSHEGKCYQLECSAYVHILLPLVLQTPNTSIIIYINTIFSPSASTNLLHTFIIQLVSCHSLPFFLHSPKS